MFGKDSDVGIVCGPVVKVWSSGQCICFIGSARNVNQLEVVVHQSWYVSCVDVLWFAVIFKVFMVCVYCD